MLFTNNMVSDDIDGVVLNPLINEIAIDLDRLRFLICYKTHFNSTMSTSFDPVLNKSSIYHKKKKKFPY